MTAYVLLHNPRCSKSRAALALLEERGVTVTLRRYLDEPLSIAELRTLRAALDLPARALLRVDEPAFRQQGLDDTTLSDDELLGAIVRAPALLQRPILLTAERAVIGRPPEQILALL